MKKLIGTLFVSMLLVLSLTISGRTSAQTVIDCDYWGEVGECDRYDCGDCVFVACGSAGGALICGFDDLIQD